MLNLKIVEEEMCPIGLAGHLLIDKWIPIIIREIALFDRRGFNEILKNNREGISSASLSSRLHYMVQLDLLNVQKSDDHAQKKLYFLTEAGIAFVPILFHLASWTAEFRNPSPEFVSRTSPFHSGDDDLKRKLLERLHQIHVTKTIEPTPLWWLADNL
ncbi:winged helix-turn-helix transcriptional regulator [Lentibacter algarum]|uniref:winged helix-turn-helix transcriptional regulator n=1 Tax=Lentibacter algarum TaxID=576131 RepID=UPI0024E1119B|nr:helix-turn-helix domain-containing protein [Lentibacter algarum]WIF33246.1 HxlR-like helix-turn-helix [Lentibacter algarum]